jgi:beta-hydroxylase
MSQTDARPAVAYKLLALDDWAGSCADGAVRPSKADRADGFLHLSSGPQLQGTLEKHYASAAALVLAELDLDALGEAVRWEPSRGGALFPHVYGMAPLTAVRRVWGLARQVSGGWRLPRELCP